MKIASLTKIKTRYIFKAILFCIAFTGFFVILSFVKNYFPDNLERITHGIIGIIAAFLMTALFLRIDKKRFSDIGLLINGNTLINFGKGAFAGILIMGFVAICVMYFSNVAIEVNPDSNVLHFFLITLPLVPLAFMEELGFRGYPLEILKGKVGIRLSILITSILFALYHIVCGWTIANAFYGPAVWGLVFGIAAVYSKGIAMPTGIHYAANLTTDAFGEAGNTVSIWTVKQSDSMSVNPKGIDWVILLPSLALLIFAIICIELYIRNNIADKGLIEKN